MEDHEKKYLAGEAYARLQYTSTEKLLQELHISGEEPYSIEDIESWIDKAEFLTYIRQLVKDKKTDTLQHIESCLLDAFEAAVQKSDTSASTKYELWIAIFRKHKKTSEEFFS